MSSILNITFKSNVPVLKFVFCEGADSGVCASAPRGGPHDGTLVTQDFSRPLAVTAGGRGIFVSLCVATRVRTGTCSISILTREVSPNYARKGKKALDFWDVVSKQLFTHIDTNIG